MDGCFARPRFSFACAKRGATRARRCVPSPQRGEGQDEGVRTQEFFSTSEPPHPIPLPSGERESQASPSLATASVVALLPTHTNPAACIAALRAPARRYCAASISRMSCRARHCCAMRHAIERAAQAAGRFAAAAALPAARLVRTSPPQGERVAIAALLQRLLDREAPRIFDRIKLWFGFHARLEHGGQHGEVLVCSCARRLSRPDSPVSRRAFAAAFCRAHDREWIARLQNMVTSSAKPVRSKERAGVGPVFRSSVTPVSPDQSSIK